MKVVTSIDLTASEPIKTGGYNGCSLNSILRTVCDVNRVDISAVKGKRRYQWLVTARREYCYLACKLTQLSERNQYSNSLATIGAEINRDHATILHHFRIIENWLDIESYKLNEKFELIENQLKI